MATSTTPVSEPPTTVWLSSRGLGRVLEVKLLTAPILRSKPIPRLAAQPAYSASGSKRMHAFDSFPECLATTLGYPMYRCRPRPVRPLTPVPLYAPLPVEGHILEGSSRPSAPDAGFSAHLATSVRVGRSVGMGPWWISGRGCRCYFDRPPYAGGITHP